MPSLFVKFGEERNLSLNLNIPWLAMVPLFSCKMLMGLISTSIFSLRLPIDRILNQRIVFAFGRDGVLASLMDGVRASGNQDIHVKMTPTKRGVLINCKSLCWMKHFIFRLAVINVRPVLVPSELLLRTHLPTSEGWTA